MSLHTEFLVETQSSPKDEAAPLLPNTGPTPNDTEHASNHPDEKEISNISLPHLDVTTTAPEVHVITDIGTLTAGYSSEDVSVASSEFCDCNLVHIVAQGAYI